MANIIVEERDRFVKKGITHKSFILVLRNVVGCHLYKQSFGMKKFLLIFKNNTKYHFFFTFFLLWTENRTVGTFLLSSYKMEV